LTASSPDWRSILEKDSALRHPWDSSKIPSIVRDSLNPRATIESRLRSSFTLRKAIEHASMPQRLVALEEPTFLGAVAHFLDHGDQTASTARVQEHALMTLVHLLGSSPQSDEAIILDVAMIRRLNECLNSDLVVVVSAASQLVRRVSELEHVCHVLGFDESLFVTILTSARSLTWQHTESCSS
jgi:hypothetical protein